MLLLRILACAASCPIKKSHCSWCGSTSRLKFTRIGVDWCPAGDNVTRIRTPKRPKIGQQVTWFYAKSLDAGADFLSNVVNLDEVQNLKQKNSLPHFPRCPRPLCWGVRLSPTARLPTRSRGAHAPPVTYTIVVHGVDQVDAWYAHFAQYAPSKVNTTTPQYSSKFDVYAFNFYDTNSYWPWMLPVRSSNIFGPFLEKRNVRANLKNIRIYLQCIYIIIFFYK